MSLAEEWSLNGSRSKPTPPENERMYHKKTAIFQKERIVSFHFHYFSGLTFIYVSFLGCSALFRSKSFLCFWFGRQRNLHLTPGTFPLLVACCSNTWRCSAGYKEGSRSLESPLIVRWAMKKKPELFRVYRRWNPTQLYGDCFCCIVVYFLLPFWVYGLKVLFLLDLSWAGLSWRKLPKRRKRNAGI